MQSWRDYLQTVMNMSLKPDSLFVIPALAKKLGYDYVQDFNGEDWTVAESIKCLGRTITATGEDHSERHAITTAWNRIFWRNSKLLCNRSAPLAARMHFWRQLAWGVADYRLAMIGPVKTNIVCLDSACSKTVRFIVGAHPMRDESREAFVVRRNREIQLAKVSVNLEIVKRACWKLCVWVENIHRHPTQQPCLDLLSCQGTDWLRQKRSDFCTGSSSFHAGSGKTNTRAGAGKPFRWDSGWVSEVGRVSGLGWENPSRDKSRTATRADALFQLDFA